jgi:glycosyltransferase involved in cell wall biosynthesis
MYLGMPVVVLAATEAPRAVPPAAGAISTDLTELHAAVSRFTRDPEAARAAGLAAREAAGARYGLKRFLREWDQVLQEVCE